MGKRVAAPETETSWLPSSLLTSSYEDRPESDVDAERKDLEERSIQYLTYLIEARLDEVRNDSLSLSLSSSEVTNVDEDTEETMDTVDNEEAAELCKGRFQDLTCTEEGEEILEKLFHRSTQPTDRAVILGSIVALQSLLILGTQVGMKGSPEQQKRFVSHLANERQRYDQQQDDILTPTQLKHRVDVRAGLHLLANLKRKRSTQSAADLLVYLKVWTYHEDLALLRSGFPLRFSQHETLDATNATNTTHDPDSLLSLRQNLRHLKVYTIDDASTTDIDDGLSIDTVTLPDGTQRNRIWVHIADADHWSPRTSPVFHSAQKRATSVYLPTGSVPMFHPHLGEKAMSLRSDGKDSYALSLSVQLNDNGSIDPNSLTISPSLLLIDYRLTYDDVDEMLDHGTAYFEEKELGMLLQEANRRRAWRIGNGSTEGFVPRPVPQGEVKVVGDEIEIKVAVTHNAGFNGSSVVGDGERSKSEEFAAPLSSAFLLVTEMMILAGEAMGSLGEMLPSNVGSVDDSDTDTDTDTDTDSGDKYRLENKLRLPYRTQAKVDFAQRNQEYLTLQSLLHLPDSGYCHAWYARRFFNPVRISSAPDEPHPHAGLGLDRYVQWTSPIRRFGDLQVHAAIKRYIRRKEVNRLLRRGDAVPVGLRKEDLGCHVPQGVEGSKDGEGRYTEYSTDHSVNGEEKEGGKAYEDKIDFKRGIGFLQAARTVQRKSKEYWIFEYLRRRKEEEGDGGADPVVFEASVLGCVDPRRFQYAIYVHELGLEYRYLSERGELENGETLWLRVVSTSPRHGLLTFGLAKI